MEMFQPSVRPACPNFSSGPCTKRPGFDQNVVYSNAVLGRSHRCAKAKAKISQALDLTREILEIPEDYRLAIVPASDTGAIEMCMWSMMGEREVSAVYWDAFGEDWCKDIANELNLQPTVVSAPYGEICDFSGVDFDTDVIFTYNATTSGVRVPDLDFIPDDREGLVFCDATSAAFAMDIDWNKLDVATFSWQKALGSEAAHGMVILSPAAIERITTFKAPRPLPKIFRMMKSNGKLDEALFKGHVINTISMLCIEDYLDALNWVKRIGGLHECIRRSESNLAVLESFVSNHEWVEFLCKDKSIRSSTSITLLLNDLEDKQIFEMTEFLEKEDAAYDINSYGKAPLGLRIWCGCTVESSDLEQLCPWLEYAHSYVKKSVISTSSSSDSKAL
eukprot:TRINITY_DN2620_c1_g1_i1.p1 TRINITY_DN2620_c1_g1~~TRINITY_DN2620_c1_g1_i1.p1  ORF type:complete len:391 (+),score=122.08 TRINITY_DN2620_c1_g1_i1:321-1493(+)